MRDYSLQTKIIIKQWMLGVMKEHGWTMARWAKIANTPRTSVTRCLDQKLNHIPSVRTLVRLSEAAGSGPNIFLWRISIEGENKTIIGNNSIHNNSIRLLEGHKE